MRADAAANRARVLEAAGAVFGEQGVDASTEEVARRAGVGIGTVFRHFPTKRDLVEAALVAHFDGLVEMESILDEQDVAAVPRLTLLMYEMAESGPTKFAMASHLVTAGELPATVRAASEQVRAVIDRLLRDCREAGAVRADVGVDELYHLLRGLAQARWTTADRDVRFRAVQIVLRGIVVEE